MDGVPHALPAVEDPADPAAFVRLLETERAARAEVEAALRASRDQLDVILGGVADGVLVQRASGGFVYANDAAARMAGFGSTAEYLGATAIEISQRLTVLDADGRPFSYEDLPARRALRGEPNAEMLVQFRRNDTGEVRWSLTRATAITGPDGEQLAISIFHDETPFILSQRRLRFLAEASARLSESLDARATLHALAQVAAETLSDWAAIYEAGDGGDGDRDRDRGDISRTALAHRDPARQQALEASLGQHPPQPASSSPLRRALATGDPQLVAPLAPGEILATSVIAGERGAGYAQALLDMNVGSMMFVPLRIGGQVRAALGLYGTRNGRYLNADDMAIAQEVARRAELALENARLYGEARAAIAARDEFLSIASHELRTPLTSIKGVAQLLARRQHSGAMHLDDLARWLQQITENSNRLAGLIDDLLDVSRLRTGRFTLRPEPLDLGAFTRGLVEEYAEQTAERHTLRFRADTPNGSAPAAAIIHGDRARLQQVIGNLLQNALKYSPDGGSVEVVLRTGSDGAAVSVSDSGIGLPEGTEESIFQPFGRAANAASRQIPGLGLGLYVCREIVARHGGRLWAESPGEDRGATFHVWLPLASASHD